MSRVTEEEEAGDDMGRVEVKWRDKAAAAAAAALLVAEVGEEAEEEEAKRSFLDFSTANLRMGQRAKVV